MGEPGSGVRRPRSEARSARPEVRRCRVRAGVLASRLHRSIGGPVRIRDLRALYADSAYIASVRGGGKRVSQMNRIKSYRDLDTWQVGMDVVEQTYRVTSLLPGTERFGLCSQMQRAAVSIPSNVAESHGRGLVRGCLYFLSVSIGSTAELDTQLEAARRLQFVSAEQSNELQRSIDRERQLLYGLRREKERQIATPVVSVLVLLALSSVSLLT